MFLPRRNTNRVKSEAKTFKHPKNKNKKIIIEEKHKNGKILVDLQPIELLEEKEKVFT